MHPDVSTAGRPRPLVSFVLVVHGDQGFLEEGAESLLERAGDAVELVAIDDTSPDHGPEVLDALAARDSRIHVHHLAERAGAGAARNLGLEHAEGEYVWFVETTGLLAPGALAPIAERLARTRPDVCVVHHRRTTVLDATSEGPHRALLARVASGEPGPLEAHPALAAAAPGVHDKLLRREHLAAIGARFADGAHGELTVSWPALLHAQRIAAVARASYVRRSPPNAARAPGGPFDALDAYASVLAGTDAPDARRRLVLPAARRHLLDLLSDVAPDRRAEYFERIAALTAAHRRGDEPAAAGPVGRARERLIDRGSYTGYRALEQAIEARRSLSSAQRAAKRQGARVKRRARAEQSGLRYRAQRRRPLDPNLAVYAAYWYRGYSCNPRAIYEKALELAPHVRGVWVVRASAADSLPAGLDHVVAGTREYFDLLARATYAINNVNFPNEMVKREGSVHVMTHHGTPLKHMGLDLRESPVTRSRLNFPALLERCRRWDYSISSNPHSTLVWERVYPVPHVTLETGYPRNDALVNATDEDVAAARAELGIEPGRKAVLYAPTHREYRRGFVPTLDVGAVAEALGPDHVLLARLHYFYDADPALQALHREGKLLDVAAHPSIETLCLAADVLVTDYSSLMFDYAILDRPIVIHAPDWEVYRATRGTYFDLLAEPPGAVARTQGELVDVLRSGADASPEAETARAVFRERFCSLEDGRASERVVRRVLLGEPDAVPARALTPA